MPWLWRPLWGAVWFDNDRAGKKDSSPRDVKKRVKKNQGGEGEQQVKNRGSVPEWGSSVLYNPYQKTGSDDDSLKHKGAGERDTNDPAGQIIDSMSRQFEEVTPGVFQFKRPVAPVVRETRPDISKRQPARVDAALFQSALPSAIAGYRKVGQTRDGLPIYTFK